MILVPFQRGQPIDGLDPAQASHVETILACYHRLDGEPVERATLVGLADRGLLDDRTDEEREENRDDLQLVCFAALAGRKFFTPIGSYANTACFTVYGQGYKIEPKHTFIRTRRRDGHTNSDRRFDETKVTIPVHVAPIEDVKVDAGLLAALDVFRRTALEHVWTRWEDAIRAFNLANTDDEIVRWQMEWVLMAGAFERILDAASKADDVAARFAASLTPERSLPVGSSRRNGAKHDSVDEPIRQAWMREFYGLRGDFAHGKGATRRPHAWTSLEHLVLAATAFPLLVRSLLAREGKHELTDDDLTDLAAFEPRADVDFTRPPDDQHGNWDWEWGRIGRDAKWSVCWARVARRVLARMDPTSSPPAEATP